MKSNFWKAPLIIIFIVMLFNATPVLSYVPDNLDFAPMDDSTVPRTPFGRTYTVPRTPFGRTYAVPDVIKMQNKAYSKHKKGIATFTHKKHVEDYKAGCGNCHHDADGKPLNDLKMGDSVQNCIDCHKKPSERPKGKGAPKLTKKQRLNYHAEAIHYNCKDCHKQFNKKNKTRKAPTTCKKCHPKKK